jgi:uncharacterized protein (DUF1810 family)
MPGGGDPFALQRFVDAQQPVYAQVCAELARGAKATHWMWFVFPQRIELGRSATARRFGIGSLAEARAYAGHALLGRRLRECTQRVLDVQGSSLEQIFGGIDALKFRSSMTLFEQAVPEDPLFTRALRQACGGERDPATLALPA